MKICLINPPSPFLLDDRCFPTLGILQVASVLEESGHEVYVDDLAGYPDYLDRIRKTAQGNWDIYGVTSTTPQWPAVTQIVKIIRDEDPGKRIIAGGPHPTVSPESCEDLFDCVVRGDGEEAIFDAINPSSPKVLDNATATQKGTLDWHVPARHLIDMDSYRYSLAGRKGTSILTEMGCPFNCSFCCGRSLAYFRRVRYRTAEAIVSELVQLSDKYGILSFTDFSDEINLQTDPLLSFCEKVTPYNFKFRAFIKANLFNDRQAEAMAKAGFVELATGVESGSNKILGVINKQTTREINKRFVDLCHKYGMRAKTFMSLAQAGETHETAMETQEWLLWARPDDFDVTIVTIYPSTPYWDEREFVGIDSEGTRVCKYTKKSKVPIENGATLFFEEIDYGREFAAYKGKPKEYISHTWTPDLSRTDLVDLRDQIEDEVRRELRIPYPKRFSGDHLAGEQNYDHSMASGMSPQDSRVAVKVGG